MRNAFSPGGKPESSEHPGPGRLRGRHLHHGQRGALAMSMWIGSLPMDWAPGDGRLLVIGTKGYIELRKYIDIARSNTPGHVILVDEKEERHFEVAGKVGFPYFGRMILDCLNRTETAISQEHIFRAIELAIEAQRKAINITRA